MGPVLDLEAASAMHAANGDLTWDTATNGFENDAGEEKQKWRQWRGSRNLSWEENKGHLAVSEAFGEKMAQSAK